MPPDDQGDPPKAAGTTGNKPPAKKAAAKKPASAKGAKGTGASANKPAAAKVARGGKQAKAATKPAPKAAEEAEAAAAAEAAGKTPKPKQGKNAKKAGPGFGAVLAGAARRLASLLKRWASATAAGSGRLAHWLAVRSRHWWLLSRVHGKRLALQAAQQTEAGLLASLAVAQPWLEGEYQRLPPLRVLQLSQVPLRQLQGIDAERAATPRGLPRSLALKLARLLWVALVLASIYLGYALYWSFGWYRDPVWRGRVLRTGFAGGGAGLMVLASVYMYLEPTNPDVAGLEEVRLETPLQVYTRDQVKIGQFGERIRLPVSFEQIPEGMVLATLAAEDDGFYSHAGVDFFALIRASLQLALNMGRIQSGGGTITMQVARNYLLTRRQTFYRKFREILLALQIERELSKERILELYLNGVFFGNRAYGVGAASEVYFKKPLQELDVHQYAMLAALPKAPSRLNPFVRPAEVRARRNWVLRRMRLLDWIDTDERLQTALRTGLDVSRGSTAQGLEAEYGAENARIQVVHRYGSRMYKEGYHLYTTLDSRLQTAAVEALRRGLEEYDRRHGWRKPENRAEALDPQLTEAIRRGDLRDFRHYYRYEEDGSPLPPPESARRVVEALKGQPVFSWAQPVYVLDVIPQAALVVDNSAQLYRVPFTEELRRWALPRITLDEFGPVATGMQDLLAPGDLVYISPQGGPDGGGGGGAGEEGQVLQAQLTQIPEVEGAMVILDANTGAIRAMVGGYSFRRSQFNRVTQAKKQIGSVVKPFLYAVALERFATPATIVEDAPLVVADDLLEGEWRPRNDSGRFYGPTRLREALVQSRNLVTVRLGRQLDIRQVRADLARVFGFGDKDLASDLSLALGNATLTPLEVAEGFAILANGGWRVGSHLVDRVQEEGGRVVLRHRPRRAGLTRNLNKVEAWQGLNGRAVPAITAASASEQALDPRITYQITDVLAEAVQRGTGQLLSVLPRSDFVGKTGTTNDAQSTWFASYNDDLVGVVWVGHDQPQPLGKDEYGGRHRPAAVEEVSRAGRRGSGAGARRGPPARPGLGAHRPADRRGRPGRAVRLHL